MKLSKGEPFDKTGTTYNIDMTREDGGNLGYIRRGQLAPPLLIEEAAFSLKKKGKSVEVVRTPYGYHIIRMEDMRGTALRPINQVKEKISFYLPTRKKQGVPTSNM